MFNWITFIVKAILGSLSQNDKLMERVDKPLTKFANATYLKGKNENKL